MVENHSAAKMTQDRMALFIDAEKQLALWMECYSRDIRPVSER